MNKKIFNIESLSKGDIITRVEPVILPETEFFKESADTVYIGSKLMFLGIANECLYLKRLDNGGLFQTLFNGSDVFKLPLYTWKNGWAFYEEPDFLDEVKKDIIQSPEVKNIDENKLYQTYKDLPIGRLKTILEDAVNSDNYELAKVIQQILQTKK